VVWGDDGAGVVELVEVADVLGSGRFEDDILMKLDGLVSKEGRKGVVSWSMVRIREAMRFMQWCF